MNAKHKQAKQAAKVLLNTFAIRDDMSVHILAQAHLGLIHKLENPSEEMIEAAHVAWTMTHPAADIRAAFRNVFKAMTAVMLEEKDGH